MNKLLQYMNSKEFNSTCNILWAIIIPFWIVLILYGQDIKDWRIKSFQAQQQKQKEKSMTKNKPVDRQKITSNDLSGHVESIHPWGRTEVVPMKRIELEYFEYCDEWVMYGDVVQPVGRKGYFMPVMRGHLDLDVKDLTQTWTEYASYSTSPDENEETFEDFRTANIKVKRGKIIDIDYTHYRLLSNKTWNIIASWKAVVNPDIPEPISPIVEKEGTPVIVCGFCKGKGQKSTDVNKLMMDASLALFVNHHLMVDKCKKCVKLPNSDSYEYCDVVQAKHETLLKEYDAAGPKISISTCDKCMGMGTFCSKDLSTGKWITQEEYDEQHKKN